MEVSLGMSVETIRRCQALFGSALYRHDSQPSTLEGEMGKGKHEAGRHEGDRDGHGELHTSKLSKPTN
jgi:hypothetical protein